MKKKEQPKNNEVVRKTTKAKNTSSINKGKHKAIVNPVRKNSRKSSKTEKLIKASNLIDATAPFRQNKNNSERNQLKASYVSLVDQHKATTVEQSTDKLDAEHVTQTSPLRNDTDHQTVSLKSELNQLTSERNDLRSSNNKAAKFLEKCEASKYLKASKRNLAGKEIIPIQLPKGLPSKLLLKALLQEQQTFTVLRDQVIQLDQADENAIDVHLDSVTMEQLTTLVKELDELVSQFTARN